MISRLPKNIPTEYQLWDADYIAEMLRLKAKYFREHVACAPEFIGAALAQRPCGMRG